MVRVDFMQTFVEVVKAGSLKKAAKKLNMSVSSVSFQINALEEFYGARLLKRGVDGVKLTEEGKIALKNIETILGSIKEAKKLITNIKGEKVIIASGMVGINMVFNIQTLLKARYPELDVKVELRGAHECIKGVLNGNYEFAIVGDILEDHLDSERLYVTELGQDRLVLITPINHPLSKKKVVTLDDIIKQPIVSLTNDYGITTSVKKALANSGIKYEDLNIVSVLGDFFSQLHSVSSGLGVAITSYYAAYKACEVGLVRIRDIEGFEGDRSIYFVTSKLSMESKKIREYAEFIIKNGRRLFAELGAECRELII